MMTQEELNEVVKREPEKHAIGGDSPFWDVEITLDLKAVLDEDARLFTN